MSIAKSTIRTLNQQDAIYSRRKSNNFLVLKKSAHNSICSDSSKDVFDSTFKSAFNQRKNNNSNRFSVTKCKNASASCKGNTSFMAKSCSHRDGRSSFRATQKPNRAINISSCPQRIGTNHSILCSKRRDIKILPQGQCGPKSHQKLNINDLVIKEKYKIGSECKIRVENSSPCTKASDNCSSFDKSKCVKTQMIKALVQQEGFDFFKSKRNRKINSCIEGGSHFSSKTEFRNVHEQSVVIEDSPHSSYIKNIVQFQTKNIKIQTKVNLDSMPLNPIAEECEISYKEQVDEEEELSEIRKLKNSLESLETNLCIAQNQNQRNSKIQNDSCEITLFLAFSTVGKEN